MKAGIMQPYFFPYLGYFSLIKHTDIFILFDSIQFIRHGWIERNRVLKQNDSWLYIQVPLVKNGRDALIQEMAVDNRQDWKAKILAQLQPYKKIAPYYTNVIAVLNEVFKDEYEYIVPLNHSVLTAVCKYLNIKKDILVYSEMDLTIEKPTAPDEWALHICKALGNVTSYWNPPGGQSFFNPQKYTDAGIDLKFQEISLSAYQQKRTLFEPGLSIIDVMMFNSVEEINEMLDQYTLI